MRFKVSSRLNPINLSFVLEGVAINYKFSNLIRTYFLHCQNLMADVFQNEGVVGYNRTNYVLPESKYCIR